MDVLIKYGFSIEEVKNMMDSNPDISNVDDKDIYNLIDILGYNGCLNNNIKNIFICNPYFLSRNLEDIKGLIKELKDVGVKNINILLDTNPYILSLDKKDIEDVYNRLLKEGYTKDEIVNIINYDSFSVL